MDFYDRIIFHRARWVLEGGPGALGPDRGPEAPADIANAILSQLDAAIQIRQDRKTMLSDARRRLENLEQGLASYLRQLRAARREGTLQSDGGPRQWPAGPDPDHSALVWFDLVVGRAGPAAVRPLLARYLEGGMLTKDEHAWFLDLSSHLVPLDAPAHLPAPALLGELDEATKLLLSRGSGRRAG